MSRLKYLLIGLTIGVILTSTVFAQPAKEFVLRLAEYPILVKGELYVDDELPFLNYEGSTYVPLRAVSEMLGVEISWNESLRRVEIGEEKTQTPPPPKPPEPEPEPEPKPEPEPITTPVQTVRLGQTIEKDGYSLTIHKISYHSDGFRYLDFANKWRKGFQVHFTVTNNSQNVYSFPRFYYSVNPELYEPEVNSHLIFWSLNPDKIKPTVSLYPGDSWTGFRLYQYARDIKIEEIEITIRNIDKARNETFGIWQVR